MNHLEMLIESQTQMLNDALYGTKDTDVMCPICLDCHNDQDSRWILPHDCAKHMPPETSFVCCNDCAVEWKERHWEEIEEHQNLLVSVK